MRLFSPSAVAVQYSVVHLFCERWSFHMINVNVTLIFQILIVSGHRKPLLSKEQFCPLFRALISLCVSPSECPGAEPRGQCVRYLGAHTHARSWYFMMPWYDEDLKNERDVHVNHMKTDSLSSPQKKDAQRYTVQPLQRGWRAAGCRPLCGTVFVWCIGRFCVSCGNSVHHF